MGREVSDLSGDGTLRELLSGGRYAAAEQHCAVQSSADPRWILWRSIVCFLNEKDLDAHYSRGPALLNRYLHAIPEDRDARFLAIYWRLLNRGGSDSVSCLAEFLAESPEHPYANLVLAANGPSEGARSHLERVLAMQPNNLRALLQLALVEEQAGQWEEARQLLLRTLVVTPYVEDTWGLLNSYVNAVLTGAEVAGELRARARRGLLRIGGLDTIPPSGR
jgi:tetratricopeptide (TPR) repeat protein